MKNYEKHSGEIRPNVSVVMPCYNVGEYIHEAMSSVLGQSLNNIEIICVNDGSTDDTLDNLHMYEKRDHRVKVLDGPNRGYGAAMNRGIEAASGEYVGILEPDDYVDRQMFARLYNAAISNTADVVKSDYFRFWTDDDGKRVVEEEKISSNPDYYNVILDPRENQDLFNMQMMNWTGIYKTEFLKEHSIVHHESPGASYQDNGFWFQVFCWVEKLFVLPEAFYYYRQDNSSSSINQNNKVFCMPDEYVWIRQFLSNYPDLEKAFLPMFHYKKFHNYNFAYSLLSQQFKIPFSERYSKEYKEAFANNELNKDFYWPDEWELVEALLVDGKHYCDLLKKRDDYKRAQEAGLSALLRFHLKYDGIKPTARIGIRRVLGRRE